MGQIAVVPVHAVGGCQVSETDGLQRGAGFSAAADVLLSGRISTGAEAAEMGLVSGALPQEELLPAAQQKVRDNVTTAASSVQ